jgi:fido (protein-threonine AMPylation protein)
MSDDPYVYPGTTILRNRPGISDAEQLDAAGAGQIMGDVNYVHPFREGNG